MTGGRVVSLQLKRRRHQRMSPVDAVRVTSDGLEGDVHGGSGTGKRVVLVAGLSDLRHLGLNPGDLREQVTVDLPSLMSLRPGERLRIGETVLEITGPCEPCTHIGSLLGADDVEEFRESLRGRRGMLCRVVADGTVRAGDSVEVLPLTRAASRLLPPATGGSAP